MNFFGKLIPFGALVRYLPNAERELEKREKLDASLRTGIFVGYRMHSGGRWTGQYTVLDAEAFSGIAQGSNRCAYEHAVTEIYVPGSSGDDQEKLSFPVADGDISEAKVAASHSEDQIANGVQNDPKDLSITIEEAFISSDRPTTFLGEDDVYPASNDGLESRDAEHGTATVSVNCDY